MKNLTYLLLAGWLFVACNQANESSTGKDPKTKEANTAPKTDNPSAPPATQETVATNPADAADPNMQQPQQYLNAPNPEPEMTVSATPENAQDNGPKLTFQAIEHDFGVVTEEGANEYSFKFTNTGSEPLIISAATATCGCTVPHYPQEPIPPGASEEIQVAFTPKGNGMNTKKITVTANTNPPTTTLTIKADVQVPAFGGGK